MQNYGYTKFYSNTKFSRHRRLEKFGDLARNNPHIIASLPAETD
jgi:hypothetical protein